MEKNTGLVSLTAFPFKLKAHQDEQAKFTVFAHGLNPTSTNSAAFSHSGSLPR